MPELTNEKPVFSMSSANERPVFSYLAVSLLQYINSRDHRAPTPWSHTTLSAMMLSHQQKLNESCQNILLQLVQQNSS